MEQSIETQYHIPQSKDGPLVQDTLSSLPVVNLEQESASLTSLTPTPPRSGVRRKTRSRSRSRSPTAHNHYYNRRSSFVLPRLRLVKENSHSHESRTPPRHSSPVTASDVFTAKEGSPSQKEFERKNLWHCCSNITIDKRMITYIVQVCISCIVLFFCMFKLTHHEEGQDPTIWVSLLSGIVGNYLPSAQLK